MTPGSSRCLRGLAVCALALVLGAGVAMAYTQNTSDQADPELREKIQARVGGVIGQTSLAVQELPEGDLLRQDWEAFVRGQNGGWKLWLDPRSGLPRLAMGKGIAWIAGPGNDLEAGLPADIEQLSDLARLFMDEHTAIVGNWSDQLVLSREASGRLSDRVWQITFAQVVDGVTVEGARYDFQVVQGNLVSFGASTWGPVRVSAQPSLTAEEARKKLDGYLGTGDRTDLTDLEPAELLFVVVDPQRADGGPWQGVRGQGYDHRLIWRFTFADSLEIATWVGEIDAHTGQLVAFYDDTKYERIQGHANPVSDDGDCATGGCPEPGYPMPYTDYSEDGGSAQTSGQHGLYECTNLGSEIRTTLNGPYVRINDVCGQVSATTTCDGELDMGVNDGINCQVAPGAAPGNTDAARSCYYSVSNVNRKARFWIPGNTWLNNQLECRSNVNSTCNATYSGRLNMYRQGNGCGNTGMINGVVVHEWGHGMDGNDGGGSDSPGEAYADVVAIFEGRTSCVGRGFFNDGSTCSGYGDTCLTCTGIRDHDWDARQAHTPATPTGFEEPNCGGGGSPCGKQVHCASYVPSESIYDLAVRDLPAMGLDQDTAWQLAERLWYQGRAGSGGPVFNCSLPNSDSCGAGTWYTQLRLQDDDDGNLNNGTPHAAAIFAAFDRHDIACGDAGDPENQNTSSCPTLAAPVVSTQILTNAVELSWPAVTDANGYRIYRNENGCDWSQMPIAEVDAATTTYRDEGLANDFNVYYRVVAIGSNTACESPVSACVQAAPQPLAGVVKFDQSTYGCSNLMTLTVKDANHSGSTINISVWSDTEPTPENVVLVETSPGSAKFTGTLMTTSDAPAPDGMLSIVDADAITAEYIDEDDGAGNLNVPRLTTVVADCVFPVISNVDDSNVTGSSADVNWTTNEISSTVLRWGAVKPPTNVATGADRVTSHSVFLGGLQECTTYFYEVESTDPAGNTALDDNGGNFYRFETLGDFGSGLQPCHAGQLTIDEPTYSCSDVASFRLVDIDLNLDSLVADTATILVTSSTELDPEIVTLTETGPNSSIFTGTIATSGGTPAPDGLLQTSEGDLMTATYLDADDGAGFPATSFDTAVLDCIGPQITNLNVNTITNSRATFSWDTQEAADTVVEWGFTPALGQSVSLPNLVTSHQIIVSEFDICGDVYFRVFSTDVFGNTAVSDNNGQPFVFSTYDIPGLYVLEDFENGPGGWALQGEWEVGAPQALGGSSGNPDPPDAYNNNGVLGQDLSGTGAFPGDYEPDTFETARSPVYNGSTWSNTKLIYHRRLNSGPNDLAELVLFTGPIGLPLFADETQITDTGFITIGIDVSTQVDGAPAVELEFRHNSDAGANFSGWNVDDIIFKDGSLPDYAACGGCASAPTFAGAASAVDNNGCGADGVTVSYPPAPAWGSGGTGSYAIYRDVLPGFTPSSGNLVVSGITSLSYNDLGAPTDQTLYYLARAENDETCGSGPNNGGLTDDNLNYVSVTETTTQPVPGEVATVRVDQEARAHVRISWDAVSSATLYRIYRAVSPEPENFGLLAETADTVFNDIGEYATSNSFYYKVTAVNSCGDEGP